MAEKNGAGQMSGTLKFGHRANDDGTIDSICSQCFTTIASSSHESDLERCERSNSCNPDQLDRYGRKQSDAAA